MSGRRNGCCWFQLAVLLLSLTLLAASTGCGGPASTSSDGSKTVTAVSLSPSSGTIAAGATDQFTATAIYSDGSTANVSSTASWAAANASVATVNSTGLVTGVAAGSTTITASLSGVSGTATLGVAAASKALESVAVSPVNATVSIGVMQQFMATATYSDGSTANVSSTVNWTATNTSVATINSSGLATGVSAGSTTITASLSGVSGTAMLNVTAKTLMSISVSPVPASIAVGATEQFTATATYNDGSTANVTTTATWTTANAAVATITPAGLATAVASGSTAVTASLSGISGTATLNVKTLTAVSVSPTDASIAMGSTEQFTATATYNDGSTANVTATVNWSIANTSVATIDTAGLATAVASGATTVVASLSQVGGNQVSGNQVSGNAPLAVTVAAATAVNVPTWHFDNQRSGLNSAEISLTPSNVTPQTFGRLFSYLVDGYVYGEPLVVSNVTIGGTVQNVLYAATENDSVYAFNADSYGTGAPLWQVSLLQSGETPMTSGPIQPVQGVTSTPVVDLSSNTIYVVSAQTSASGTSSFRLNALDITTGAQKFGGPVTIQASVSGTSPSAVNGLLSLGTECIQRSALLLANGMVYIGFGGCESGWLLAYNAATLVQAAIFNASPNLNGEGSFPSAGGIWMGGAGAAADSSGNVYVTTGNGPFDPQLASWGDTVLKFNAQLQMQDYFAPDNYDFLNCRDTDLGSGGLLLIPGTTEALTGGKSGELYLVNTADLGHEQAGDTGATQTLYFEPDVSPPYSEACTDTSGTYTTDLNSYEIFGTGAYFDGSVYVGVTPTAAGVDGSVRQFTYSGTLTAGSYTSPSIQQGAPGITPFISANGTDNGIVWMIDPGFPLQNPVQSPLPPTNATLRAYQAGALDNELYNSSVNAGDIPGYGIKFTSPIVANGKVYISTAHDLVSATNPHGEIDVYGLN